MPKITVSGGPTHRLEVTRLDSAEPEYLEVDEAPAEGAERPEGDDYASWTYKELLGELRRRDLPRGGNTAELAERLKADDREQDR